MVYVHGFLLGISLITALGPQNVFLIRQGVRKNHAGLSAFICFCCDIILVTASVVGLNELLKLHPFLQIAIAWFGVLFLTYYGSLALYAAWSLKNIQTNHQKCTKTRLQIISMALGFSLLNPHAIIDSLVIIGGGSSQFPGQHTPFLLGVLTSSLIWFVSITLTTRYFSSTLSKANVWRCIEGISGSLMIYIAIKLSFYALSI